MVDQAIQHAISSAITQFESADDPATYPHIHHATITEVSQILRSNGDIDGSGRPRIYILLHLLNLTHYRAAFSGHSDDHLPYLDWTLPEKFGDDKARRDFLKWQKLVTSEESQLYGPKVKPHMEFKDESSCRLVSVKVLGHGAWGVVDSVEGEISRRVFARKRFFRKGRNPDVRRILASFEKELKAFKRLRHHHLVAYVGSYTDPTGTSLMMLPVAECDLSTWLQQHSEMAVIRRFFGCLSSALAFLHRQKVRHKDIKPSNILVHGNRVLLSDFGSSLDWEEKEKSSTSGNAEAGTRVYAAPEALDHERRGSSSDIFSLGCVFLELATTLCGHLYDDLYQHLKENGTCVVLYGDNEEGIISWVEELKKPQRTLTELRLFDMILRMLHTDKMQRPAASNLADDIMDLGEEFSCGLCRVDRAVQDSRERGPALHEAARKGDNVTFRFLLSITDYLDFKAVLPTIVSNCLISRNLSTIEVCLSHCQAKGWNIDARSALSWAAVRGDEQVADLLMNFGADPNAIFEPATSPLYIAALKGHERLVQKMISRGANLDRKEKAHGKTVLHAAVTGPSDTSILKLLLAQKPDVNVAGHQGTTPLMEAVRFSKPLIFLLLLLEAGADPGILETPGHLQIDRAYRNGANKVVQAFLSADSHHISQSMFFNFADPGLKSPLNTVLRILKARVLEKDKNHRALLHLAIKAQCEGTVKMLLEQTHLLDLQSKDDKGQTPLHYAAELPSTTILQSLLSQRHAPTMHRDSDGNTPLHLAVAKSNSVASVRLLIEQDYEAVDVKSKSGETPLCHACKDDKFLPIVELLIENGAKIHYVAISSGNTLLHIAAAYGSTDIVRFLLNHELSVEAKNYSNKTPLHLAASYGNRKTLRLLLERGASVKTQDKYGYTAIGSAASTGRHRIVLYLKQTGDAAIDEVFCGSIDLRSALLHGNKKAEHTLKACGAVMNARG